MKKLILTIIIVFIGALSFGQDDGSKEFNEAQSYKQSKEFDKWIELIKKSAEKGYPEAYGSLGDAYFMGIGVEKNLTKSLENYCKAGDNGHAMSAYWAADMYLRGEGAEASQSNALKYFKLAAENGNEDAVKECYRYMDDKKAAFEYLKKLVELKNYEAANLIGEFYITGNGVERDLNTAMEWLKKGEAANHAGCLYTIGYIYRNGDSQPEEGKVQLFAEGKDAVKAAEYYQKAAKLGNVDAMLNLGEMFAQGVEIQGNYESSFYYFDQACRAKSGYACYMCSLLIVKGAVEASEDDAAAYAGAALKLGYDPTEK